MAVKTQLTHLYYRTGAASTYALVKVPSLTAIPVPAPTAATIEVTNMDSTAKEFIAGLVDNGTITLTLNHISFGETNAALYETFMTQSVGTETVYIVAMADGTVAPTVNATTGAITYSTGRSHRTFTGIFGGAGDTFAVNDAVRCTAEVTISGAVTRTPKSA